MRYSGDDRNEYDRGYRRSYGGVPPGGRSGPSGYGRDYRGYARDYGRGRYDRSAGFGPSDRSDRYGRLGRYDGGYASGRYGGEGAVPGWPAVPLGMLGWNPALGWIGGDPAMGWYPGAFVPPPPPARPEPRRVAPRESPEYGMGGDRALRNWARRYGYDFEYTIRPRDGGRARTRDQEGRW